MIGRHLRRLQVPGTTMDPRWLWASGRAEPAALVCPMPGFGDEDRGDE